jgi:hypothetical protein
MTNSTFSLNLLSYSHPVSKATADPNDPPIADADSMRRLLDNEMSGTGRAESPVLSKADPFSVHLARG